MAPDLISLFKSCTGNLVGLNAAQLFEYSSDPGKGKDAERGHKKKRKMGLTFRQARLREVTSSRPFQRTWPPAV